MQFRAEFFPKPFKTKIRHSDRLMLTGSCFTEQVGQKLLYHKFPVVQNPNGILFNPVSIVHTLYSCLDFVPATRADLFYHNELWGSWQHHTRFSYPDADVVLERINAERKHAADWLSTCDWLMITLGSAWVYERDDASPENYANVVANCHKVPPDKFNRRLLQADEIVKLFKPLLNDLFSRYPHLRIIFTVSPVRHLREGFIENNRSKAALITAVHELSDAEKVLYFPAYELVIDDLRDYRFFAEDLAHPNYAATNYVWEKFQPACIDDDALHLMKEINAIMLAVHHKPFNPSSKQHAAFKETYLQKALQLKERYTYLDLEEEIRFLSA